MANKEAKGVALLNLGCRVNRVELDLMASDLIQLGCAIVEPEDAAAIIVNTCAVTAEAEAKQGKPYAMRRLFRMRLLLWQPGVASLLQTSFSSLAPNVVVEVHKDMVAEVVMQELGCALDGVTDEGYLRKANPTDAPVRASRFRTAAIIAAVIVLCGRHEGCSLA